jgi:hypothetical protein
MKSTSFSSQRPMGLAFASGLARKPFIIGGYT